MSPSKFVFMACVALKVRFHGVCRPQSSFSWRVSPHKFIFMALITSESLFIAYVAFRRFPSVCHLRVCFLGVSPFGGAFHLEVCFHWVGGGVCCLQAR